MIKIDMAHSLTIFKQRLRDELDTLRTTLIEGYQNSHNTEFINIAEHLKTLNYSDWPEYLESHFVVKCEPNIKRLIELEAAIAQFEIGQYGLCADCEAPITLNALNRDPATQRCAECDQ